MNSDTDREQGRRFPTRNCEEVSSLLTSSATAGHRLRLVIGGCDMEGGAVSLRLHHGNPQVAKPKAEVMADILAGIKERRN